MADVSSRHVWEGKNIEYTVPDMLKRRFRVVRERVEKKSRVLTTLCRVLRYSWFSDYNYSKPRSTPSHKLTDYPYRCLRIH